MPTVEQLLSQLFEGRGYQVVSNQVLEGASGAQYRVPVLAKASKDTVLVWVATDASVTVADAEAMTAAVHDVGADLGVVAAMSGAEPAAVAAAAHGRVEVWSRGRFALEIGESVIHAAADAHPTLTRVPAAPVASEGPLPATPMAAQAPQVPVARSQPREFGSLIQKAAAAADSSHGSGAAMFLPSTRRVEDRPTAPPGPLAYAWGGGANAKSYNPNATRMPGHATRQVDQWGNAVTTPPVAPAAVATQAPAPHVAPAAQALPPPPPQPQVRKPEEGQALAMRVDQNKAAEIAAGTVGAVRGMRFVLEPSIAFSWAWAGWIEAGKPPLETKGVMLVSQVDGKIHEVADPEWTPAPAAERSEGHITAVDVYESVKSRLVKLTTREVKVSREVGGEEVYEKKRVGPHSPDEAGFEHHGVVFVPTWIVQGERGEVRVDGFTGEVHGAPPPPAAAPAPRPTGAQLLS